MRINIKPHDKHMIYETAEQAINHVFIFGLYSKDWKTEKSFGQSITERKKIDTAIRFRDFSAFKASKRRGYWLIELA